MFVVFTSVVEFLIIAMYMGRIPAMAEQDSLEPTGTMEDENGKTTLGKTNKKRRFKSLNTQQHTSLY